MRIASRYLFFLLSGALNSLSLHCARFSVTWLVMRETNSAVAFAAVYSASSLAETYSKPLLSHFADYFDRLHMYRITVALTACILSALTFYVAFLPFSIIFVTSTAVFLSLIAGLRDTVSAGLVTILVPASQIGRAQSISASVGSVINLCAPIIAALLLISYGVFIGLIASVFFLLLGLATSVKIRPIKLNNAGDLQPWLVCLKTWRRQTALGIRAVALTR